MIYKILILALIITMVIAIVVSAMMIHFLSDRKATVDAIFSGIEPSDRDKNIRDQKWEDRQWLENMPYEIHSITSFDGITLKAKYVEAVNATDKCVICVHGFHSSGYKEFASIGRFYLENGINVFLVDQRGNGDSGGRMITYGDREQKDILDWIKYAVSNLGENMFFALHGISMGSATVMLISDRVDARYIKYIAADCGYTVGKDQLLYTIKSLGLPARILYLLYSWGCRLIKLYNPDDIAPVLHVEKALVPMIFAQGADDKVVPVAMAKELYKRCGAEKKKLVIGEGAKHTQAFYLSDDYKKTLIEYMNN